MRLPIVAMSLTACLLAGCTDADWDHALSFAGAEQAEPAGSPDASAQPPPPVASAAAGQPDESWCKEAAGYERDNAAIQGFDAATQQRAYATRFNQCMQAQGTAPR